MIELVFVALFTIPTLYLWVKIKNIQNNQQVLKEAIKLIARNPHSARRKLKDILK